MPYNPINILWIEDNPLQSGIRCSLINDREQARVFEEDLDHTIVPAIFFETHPEYHKYFRLQVLQHPEEIREYIASCLKIEDLKGTKALGATEGAVPELVIFDYKLQENIEIGRSPTSIKYSQAVKAIREYVNPLFKIYKAHPDLFSDSIPYLESSEITSYLIEDFIGRINFNTSLTINDETTLKDLKELENDQLGLFAGVEISRMFRVHPCVAVPATFNNSDVSRMHVLSKFYEWLNEYDLGTMFSAEQRRDKKWDIILPHAVRQLRIRISAQIQTGQIIPNYGQLIRLAEFQDSSNGSFPFISAYGERNLPLDGLFIDEVEETRGQKIAEWAETLIERLPTNNADVSQAINISNKLWEIFQEKFVDRIDLSDHAFREPKGLLDEGERTKFASLKDKYCTNGKINTEYSIQKSFEGQKGKAPTVRLAVLHLITTAAVEMNKCSVIDPTSASYAELSKHEYFNVLFPFVNLRDSLLLPMHAPAEWDRLTESRRKWLETNLSLEKSNVTRANCLECKEWITDGEKTLLKAIFYDEREFFPPWLTS